MSAAKVKMICVNPVCLNKGIVYRNAKDMDEPTCKGCGSPLKKYKAKRPHYVRSVREVAYTDH